MKRALLLLAACGGATAPSTPQGPPASLDSAAAGSGDVIVARVAGHPVWGSCVAAQARREHVDARAALAQCIDFELLAQEAAKRGLASDREVVDATRDALVDQLVARGYEDAFTKPEDFGAFWNELLVKHKVLYSYKHVEYRASSYVRVVTAQKPPAEDPAARATAERIAAALADERGLTAADFHDLATRAAAGAKLEYADVDAYRKTALDDAYGDALWAIPEVGRTSPVVRTQWGYDVILLTDDVPATDPSPDELVREVLPEVQRDYFGAWVGQLAHAMGLHVQVDPAVDDRLKAL